MKNYGKVKVFEGNVSDIITIYNYLNSRMAVDVVYHGQNAELQVFLNDYVKAVKFGSEVVMSRDLVCVQRIDPNGKGSRRFAETAVRSGKSLYHNSMVVLSSGVEMHIASISKYLSNAEIDNIISYDNKSGRWQIVVKPENYMSAVNIGAKYASGHGWNEVAWHNPADAINFDVYNVAGRAIKELDDALEA